MHFQKRTPSPKRRCSVDHSVVSSPVTAAATVIATMVYFPADAGALILGCFCKLDVGDIKFAHLVFTLKGVNIFAVFYEHLILYAVFFATLRLYGYGIKQQELFKGITDYNF